MNHWAEFKAAVKIILESAAYNTSISANRDALVLLKASYFGSKQKSIIGQLHRQWKNVLIQQSSDQKRYRMQINDLVINLKAIFAKKAISFEQKKLADFSNAEIIDLEQISTNIPKNGSIHIFSYEKERVIKFFKAANFQISVGNEITLKRDNFRLLNISEEHVANEESDTFSLQGNPNWILRTHCTNGTAYNLSHHTRLYKDKSVNYLTFGKAFRNDTHDSTHLHEFYQLDGCMIGKNWSIVALKLFLEEFLHYFLEKKVRTRFRVNYFPFTSPSFEMDIRCEQCNPDWCALCKNTKWIEILGAGVVHPKVLKNTQIDNTKGQQVVAFGLGLERIMMLKYQIKDIRYLYSHDPLWLKLTNF